MQNPVLALGVHSNLRTGTRKDVTTIAFGVEVDEPFQTIHLDSASDFIDHLLPNGPLFRSKDLRSFATGLGAPTWVFRGVDNADYPLLPTALRDGKLLLTGGWKSLESPISDGDQARAEYSTLLAFFWALDEQGLWIPEDSQALRSLFGPSRPDVATLSKQRGEWLPDSLLSLAALAQHYGLPTRLLDWSYHALTAAYFAAAGTPGKRLCVWALDLSALPMVDREGRARGFLRHVSAPRAGNPNLHAQDGLFTMYTPIPFDWDAQRKATPVEQLVQSWGRIRNSPILFKITLEGGQAEDLLRLLRRHGITAARLLPGYAGVVKSLKERGSWGTRWGSPEGIEIPHYYLRRAEAGEAGPASDSGA